MSRKKSTLTVFLLLCIGFLAGGCASTQGSYKALVAPAAKQQLAKYTNLKLEVDCRDDVSLSPTDKERIQRLIVTNLASECPGRFKAVNPETELPDTLNASVIIRKYDEGSAFARAMLAGLGKMHIDADVVLTDPATQEQVAKYDVTKTFAWGGLYGGFTGIKEIEDGFAKAVAAAIAGKPS